ncbi:hypothetical protein LW135_00960 [Helicobacter sp. faydin-H20]|uniref:hypothetical protein n=1 Tax=Helicobacter anatolicus TaxID=2905874 RepID=UPI001E48929C|nr:hypothetical protein [Helicobacter anatolicus]MCE3036403.1 hypothetical protein [Helicobacter anatolicus]
MRVFVGLIFCFAAAFCEWHMFADKEETYLYNTTTGEVYVKHKKGGKNYQDVFVKMPKGLLKLEEEIPVQKQGGEQKISKEMQLESIKKAQELMQKSFDTGGM